MKDDAGLRSRMGAAGRETVCLRAIDYVVKDLLQWYARGAAKRAQRSLLFKLGAVLVLMASVPFTIALFYVYNITVSFNLLMLENPGRVPGADTCMHSSNKHIYVYFLTQVNVLLKPFITYSEYAVTTTADSAVEKKNN